MLSHLKCSKSRGRFFCEPTAQDCSEFELDKEKILLSPSFRKLANKTQVFFNDFDHYRTRLTHTLEVAHVAKTICMQLGLNEKLAEAISLAHDIGHLPFAHAGEDCINSVLKHYGLKSFNHNVQSLRIVTKIEKLSESFDGLNLTYEVIEGLIKHNGPILENDDEFLKNFAHQYGIDLSKYPTMEAQIASIADDIAYTGHDIEDGWRSGILKFKEIAELPVISDYIKNNTRVSEEALVQGAARYVVKYMISKLKENILTIIEEYNIQSIDDISNINFAVFSAEFTESYKTINSFLFRNLYKAPEIHAERNKVYEIMYKLFSFYTQNTQALPLEWQKMLKNEASNLIICDFFSCMTDKQILKIYNDIFPEK